MTMTRALHVICCALVVCAGLTTTALAKPKVAVLGLEASAGPSGAVDPPTTHVAREVTKELRQRARSGASPYTLAPNSERELTDEKLLVSCDTEGPECMKTIAVGIGADKLLFGHVEKRGDTFRVVLKLLDVQTKGIQQEVEETPNLAGAPLAARKLYTKLIGDSPAGNGALVIRATGHGGAEVRGGKVFVDDEPRGELAGGKLTVTGIGEGRHTVAIEASGFRRFEQTIAVRGGEQLPLNAELLDKGPITKVTTKPATAEESGGRGPWLAMTIGGGVVASAGLGFFLWQVHRTSQAGQSAVATVSPGGGVYDFQFGDCGKSGVTRGDYTFVFNAGKLSDACTAYKLQLVGGGVAIVGGVVGVVGLIQLLRSPSTAEHAAAERPARGPRVAIEPVLAPDTAGAQLSVRW